MYRIVLPNFEGPFDLLLYFIKRDELSIYDIPIARIAEEFQKYVRVMQIFDLELAGEFLVTASTLMYIKSQMLLPRPNAEDDEEIEDPRTNLVERLIEYKRFKDVSREMAQMAEEQRYVYYRRFFESETENVGGSAVYKNAGLFDLIRAFKKALEREKVEVKDHVVEMFPITVAERSGQILDVLKRKKRVTFFELIDNTPATTVIVTFLSILDLIKSMKIFVAQSGVFDDIVITEKREFALN